MSKAGVQSVKSSFWLRLAEQWSRWTGGSVNRSIFGAAVTIGVLTVVVKLVGATKELIVAATFGTTDVLDEFLIAYLLPFFAINVVAGSFNAALIPTFIRVREQEGRQAAQRLLSSLACWSLALLGGVTLMLILSARFVVPLLASGFSPQKLTQTQSLFFLLTPTLVICGLSTTWSAVLNSQQRFALAALTPVITPVVAMTALVLFGRVWGVYSLAGATVCGFATEAGVLGWGLNRLGFSLRPRWHGFEPAMKQVIGQYAPMVTGAVLMSGTILVDQAMAAMLGTGSVAVLSYGSKVVTFIVSIGSLAIGTAVLPHFSRMVAAEEWSHVRHTLQASCRLILLSALPVAAALIFWSEPLVRLLFERGTFSSRDTRMVSSIAACLALQIPFYLVGIVGVRLLNAMRKGRSIMLICIVNMVANVAGNYLLMRVMGVAGIALATSLVYLLSCMQVFHVILKELKRRQATQS